MVKVMPVIQMTTMTAYLILLELSQTQTNPLDPDHDDDGVIDSLDNCKLIFNDQTNTDRDLANAGIPVPPDDEGDACDTDDDNDTVNDIDDVNSVDHIAAKIQMEIPVTIALYLQVLIF